MRFHFHPYLPEHLLSIYSFYLFASIILFCLLAVSFSLQAFAELPDTWLFLHPELITTFPPSSATAKWSLWNPIRIISSSVSPLSWAASGNLSCLLPHRLAPEPSSILLTHKCAYKGSETIEPYNSWVTAKLTVDVTEMSSEGSVSSSWLGTPILGITPEMRKPLLCSLLNFVCVYRVSCLLTIVFPVSPDIL